MIENVKAVDSPTVADLQAFPVWQYRSRESVDETFVRPVKRTPVTSLTGRIVGTQVALANNKRVWALIGNGDSTNPKMTEHFLTLSVERDGRWFTLARYHDFDSAERGPAALAQFLGLTIDETVPIAYDIRQVTQGDEAALKGEIREAPREDVAGRDHRTGGALS